MFRILFFITLLLSGCSKSTGLETDKNLGSLSLKLFSSKKNFQQSSILSVQINFPAERVFININTEGHLLQLNRLLHKNFVSGNNVYSDRSLEKKGEMTIRYSSGYQVIPILFDKKNKKHYAFSVATGGAGGSTLLFIEDENGSLISLLLKLNDA